VLSGKKWIPTNVPELNREIGATNADIEHIQYPATGYGWHLGPQLLSLMRPFVVTIHECSQAHILRQLSLLLFSIRARRIIFTNEYECAYASLFAPWIKNRAVVIPIGTNIPVCQSAATRLPGVVVYFGLVRPQKGLEEVIRMAELCKLRGNSVSVRIIGTVLPGCEDYCCRLRAATENLPVRWLLDLDDQTLSAELAQAEIAYLPFPDGASERRSSLIAMLVNGAAIITTRGSHTPSAMEKAVLLADSPAHALDITEELFKEPQRLRAMQIRAAEFATRFAWEDIAAKHLLLYEQLLGQSISAGG
jgi:glycosyltransferase involved in cell wall biosynthesis